MHDTLKFNPKFACLQSPSSQHQELDAMPMEYLEVPLLTKQFLISPPASPPVDWEPEHEDPPVVDEEFLCQFSGLNPGMPRIVLQAENSMPAIQVCDFSDPVVDDTITTLNNSVLGARLAVPLVSQAVSRMPPRKMHLEVRQV